VSIANNIAVAQEINAALSAWVASAASGAAAGLDAAAAQAFRLAWVTWQFAPGQSQDYKQAGGQYREFGNFNYGAVASALGLSPQTVLWGAGTASYANWMIVSVEINLASQALAEAGMPARFIGPPPASWGTPVTGPPYGDNPSEQAEIQQGINYFSAVAAGCH
jgi:hypothetical protein